MMTEKEIQDAIRPLDSAHGGQFKILPFCHGIQPGDLFVQQQQDVGYPRNIFAVLRPSQPTADPVQLLTMLNPVDISAGGALQICSRNHKIQKGDLLIHQKGESTGLFPARCGLVAVLRRVQPSS